MHLVALDGLRGLAAISVVFFHLGHWLGVPWLATNSYLAVDFFFCLSGYVLPLAYGGEKHGTMRFATFLRVRLIRLMPLIVLASTLGATYQLAKSALAHDHGTSLAIMRAYALSLLCLPDLGAPKAIGGPQVFPLNGPQFTLMLELGINLIWFPIRHLHPLRTALVIASASFAVLAVTGLGGDTGATILLGMPRVAASFFAGVALFHAARRWPVRTFGLGTILGVSALILGLFFLPQPLGIAAVLVWCMALVPAIVFVGSRTRLSPRSAKAASILGALSYPIYALHYPIFCWINGAVQSVGHRMLAVEIPLVVLAVLIGAAVALWAYDIPVRRRLLAATTARPPQAAIGAAST